MIGVISYLVFFTTIAAILSIAVLGLNLQWGYTGLFNGGVVASFGAGAYGTLILGSPPAAGHRRARRPACPADAMPTANPASTARLTTKSGRARRKNCG